MQHLQYSTLPRTNTGTASVAYKYAGKELDTTTGLYFYKAVITTPLSAGLFQPILLRRIRAIFKI